MNQQREAGAIQAGPAQPGLIQGNKPCGSLRSPAHGHPISCDQVAWLMDVFERHIPKETFLPAVSRSREMQKYAMLYEVMEAAGLSFEDESAQGNGTPNDVSRFMIR